MTTLEQQSTLNPSETTKDACSKSPKVSVCIPSYNYSRFISDAITSVLNQSLGNFELVIVDDNSTDDSESVIRGFQDSRIRYFRNEVNLGITANWNKCLSLARGSYVCIMGADDIYFPDFLTRMCFVLDSNFDVGFAHCAFKLIDEDGKILRVYQRYARDSVENGQCVFRKLLLGNYVMFSSVLIRKECLRILGGFDSGLSYTLDWEMLARMSLAYKVAYVSEPLSCFRTHSSNLTRSCVLSGRYLTDGFRAIDLMLAQIPQHSGLETLKGEASRYKSRYLLNNISERIMSVDTASIRDSIAEAVFLYPPIIFDPRTLSLCLVSLLGHDNASSVVASLKTHLRGAHF